jgi:hypothetical protein
VGRLLQEQIEEGKALKLSRKQLRRGFSSLGTQLTDSNEGLIFEALGEGEQKVFVWRWSEGQNSCFAASVCVCDCAVRSNVDLT